SRWMMYFHQGNGPRNSFGTFTVRPRSSNFLSIGPLHTMVSTTMVQPIPFLQQHAMKQMHMPTTQVRRHSIQAIGALRISIGTNSEASIAIKGFETPISLLRI